MNYIAWIVVVLLITIILAVALFGRGRPVGLGEPKGRFLAVCRLECCAKVLLPLY